MNPSEITFGPKALNIQCVKTENLKPPCDTFVADNAHHIIYIQHIYIYLNGQKNTDMNKSEIKFK